LEGGRDMPGYEAPVVLGFGDVEVGPLKVCDREGSGTVGGLCYLDGSNTGRGRCSDNGSHTGGGTCENSGSFTFHGDCTTQGSNQPYC
jgi:hypothetical protein